MSVVTEGLRNIEADNIKEEGNSVAVSKDLTSPLTLFVVTLQDVEVLLVTSRAAKSLKAGVD